MAKKSNTPIIGIVVGIVAVVGSAAAGDYASVVAGVGAVMIALGGYSLLEQRKL